MYSLGKYSTNYQTMEMEFTGVEGQKVVLRGMNTYPPTAVTSHRLEAVLQQGDMEGAAECFVTFKKPPYKATQQPAVFRDRPAGRPPDRGFESFPPLDDEGQLILIPERILEVREQKLRNKIIRDYLVQWKDLPIEEATWETEQVLQHPALQLLEDKQIRAGRIVMSSFA